MKRNLPMVMIVSLIVSVMMLVIWKFNEDAANRRAWDASRRAYSEKVCKGRGDGSWWFKRQQIGFGSFEHRVFCDDGYWQVIP